MSIAEHICSEVDYPACKLFDVIITKYPAKSGMVLDALKMDSPYTVMLILIAILCAIRMILHINSLHSSIGRGEMRTVFTLYIASNFVLLFIVGFPKALDTDNIFLAFNIVQLTLESTMFFSLFASAITIDHIYGILWMSSSTFMRIMTAVYSLFISCAVIVCCVAKNDLIIPLLFTLNSVGVVAHIALHNSRLKNTKSEIWDYGVLWIVFCFFALSTVHSLVGARLVALLTERTLDNFFFVTMYRLATIIMIHKFWLNTCDFELECLVLDS